MPHASITDDELAALVRRNADAADALIKGDVERYLGLIEHADDYTLIAPYGGEVRRGFDRSDAARRVRAQFFQGGEAEFQVVEAYRAEDLVVLVAIERQRGKVGGLAEQDLSLRVTVVFRREEGRWRLVHRHADPLVHGITVEQMAARARG